MAVSMIELRPESGDSMFSEVYNLDTHCRENLKYTV
jgi:hypothetical protein